MSNSTTPKFLNVTVRLSGKDGNVFLIVGRVRKALAQAGVADEDLQSFLNEMLNAGSYDEALRTVMRWVDVS